MVTLAACQPSGPSAAEMDAIKAVNGAWDEHYNAGDAGAVAADPAHYKVEFENDKVRVLRISCGPKEKSVMHAHPQGVVVFLNNLQGRFTMHDGTSQDVQTKAGTVGWTDATIHNPENVGDKPFEVIQVEQRPRH
jgi:mannose-6-phosphate isomerase-like protein (cupin superfamily)